MDSVDDELEGWLAQMPDGVHADVEAARQRIGRIARLFERALTGIADRHGLSTGDLAALSALRRSGEPFQRTPRELAATLGLTSGTVSVRIDRLIRAGLIEPVAGADGRSRPVRLTRRGVVVWTSATAERTAFERDLVSGVLTDTDLHRLNPLLGRLLEGLETEFGQAPRHDMPG